MKKINIKIWFKKFKHAFKRIGSDADKDWKIALSLFIIAFIISIFIHTKMFFEVQDISDQYSNQFMYDTKPADTGALADMLNKYDKREKEYNSIASSTIITVDPN